MESSWMIHSHSSRSARASGSCDTATYSDSPKDPSAATSRAAFDGKFARRTSSDASEDDASTPTKRSIGRDWLRSAAKVRGKKSAPSCEATLAVT